MSVESPSPPARKEVDVGKLHLDPINPRLPEDLQGSSQVELLKYLYENGTLDELMRSMSQNGFFDHEPLIAFDDPELGYVVLEGNRRLASLKILNQCPEAVDLGIEPALDSPVEAAVARRLRRVPVYVVTDRDEVHRYLGFRHIGGIKTWSAESKARYLMQEVDRAALRETDPFLEVGRRVGSNSLGVRNSYTAISVLRHAREEYGLKVTYVLHNRFGVWSRCMTAPDVRHYVGLNGAKTYEEVRADIRSVEPDRLAEVLDDMTPPPGRKKALLNDSRDVTVYGQVLMHEVARGVLRRYEDLQVARQIVELAALPERLRDIRDRIDVALEEAQGAEWSRDLEDASDLVFRSARSLRATVSALSDNEDDEP